MAAWSGAIPTDWETRQPVEIRCGRASHSVVDGDAQVPNRSLRDTRVWRSCGGEMHPRGHGSRHAARSTGGGGGSNPMRHAPERGRHGHQTRQAAASRDLKERSRGTRGRRRRPASKPGLSWRCEVVAVAGEASRAVRSRDTVTATPSAPNKRPSAPVESDTPRSPHATAGQLHRGASRSNAGPYRLRRKTADRPATLTDSYAGPGR